MSIQMREITEEDYEEFLKKHKEVVFEDNVSGKRVIIKLEGRKFIPENELYPKDFELEGTTVWSFPQRGTWATKGEHKCAWMVRMKKLPNYFLISISK